MKIEIDIVYDKATQLYEVTVRQKGSGLSEQFKVRSHAEVAYSVGSFVYHRMEQEEKLC